MHMRKVEVLQFLHYVTESFCQGDLQKAAEIVQESGDRASAYHFARQMENQVGNMCFTNVYHRPHQNHSGYCCIFYYYYYHYS